MRKRPSFVSGVTRTKTLKEPHISEPRINERIRVPEVRLVGPNGEQVGIVRVEEALRLAADADLDLVEVAPMARPPVAKLMDFGKFKYEAALKAREARKNQVNTVIKEIKLRPKIDPHDYGTKKGHVERFLKAGDKVKVTIMFRGREQSRPELGFRLLQRLAEDVVELGFVESAPKQDGRNMIMVIGPTKRKAEAKAEARRARESAPARSGAGEGGEALSPAPEVVPETAVTPAPDAAPASVAAPASEVSVPERVTAPSAGSPGPTPQSPSDPAAAAVPSAPAKPAAAKPAPAPRGRGSGVPSPSAPSTGASAPRPRPAAARPAPPTPRPTPRAPKA
jgi:translation initiation factor IF-3